MPALRASFAFTASQSTMPDACASRPQDSPSDPREPQPPRAARSREHPHHPRGRGRVRAPGHALLDRQGQLRDAAPRAQGLPPRPPAVPAPARGHDVEVPRHVRVPRPDRRRARARAHRPRQRGGRAPRHQPIRPRLGRAHRRHEDRGAQAGARGPRVRRRLRRRPPRRGEVARQGARLLVPLRPAPLGSPQPAPRALAPVQRSQAPGRVDPRLPALQLDRARRVGLHRARVDPDRAALPRRRAPGRRARRRAHHGRRRAHAPGAGRDPAAAARALPHPRRLPAVGRDRERRRQRRGDHRRDAPLAELRARGPGHRPRRGGLDGAQEAGGILLSATVTDTPLLRFITCGSVDDGKSTLVGRLLFESELVPDDHVAALAADSRRAGTRGGELDYALLLDGLAAEREQGITIDVAYRYFATARRSFIVADTPGHEQYTRNMVTGASTADCAVLLLDARKGVLTQTRRHLFLATLLGVHHVALAVNKMDLVGFSPERFAEIEGELRALAAELGIEELTCIPVCAVDGDNVVSPSERTPWYEGPTVLGYLETVEVDQVRMESAPFRMPVQLVVRPDADFRGFAGTIGGGTVRPGDRVRVLPSGLQSTVE